MVKLAICYWGMTRSTKHVYESHYTNLFNILKTNNIEYDIFMHTWRTENNENIIHDNPHSISIDYDEYKLLNPTYYKIENQSEFLETITFSDYFNKEIYEKYGDGIQYEWRPMLIRNHLCALESQKRVYKMVNDSGNAYDFILYIRPDNRIVNQFDHTILFKDFDIVLPNNNHNEGYNDRFALIPFNKAMNYSTRIDEIADFRKHHGRIVSEKYTKFIVDKYYTNISFIDFFMNIVRPDGYVSPW
jgi:hypothetical protein